MYTIAKPDMLAAKDYIHPTYTPKLIFQILKHGISCLLWFVCCLFIVFIEPGWGLYISYVRVICETSQAWRKDDERCHSWQSKTRHDSFTSSYIFVDHKMLHMTKSVKSTFANFLPSLFFTASLLPPRFGLWGPHAPRPRTAKLLSHVTMWRLGSWEPMENENNHHMTTYNLTCKWQLDSNVRTTGLKHPINTHMISTYQRE